MFGTKAKLMFLAAAADASSLYVAGVVTSSSLRVSVCLSPAAYLGVRGAGVLAVPLLRSLDFPMGVGVALLPMTSSYYWTRLSVLLLRSAGVCPAVRVCLLSPMS